MGLTPQWIKDLPAQALDWTKPLMSTRQFGLFRGCAGEGAPHLITTSTVALGLFRKYGSLSDLPGYSEQAILSLVEYLQDCQDRTRQHRRHSLRHVRSRHHVALSLGGLSAGDAP